MQQNIEYLQEKEGGKEQQVPVNLTGQFDTEAERFLGSSVPLLKTVAGNSNVSFAVSDSSYFDHENREINIKYDSNIPKTQNLWIGAHEVGHFTDLLQDPDSYIENFTYCNKRARTVASDFLNKLNQKGVDTTSFQKEVIKDSDGKPLSRIENVVLNELNDMYNVVDDIAVNRRIPQKITMFAKDGSRGSDVKDLYEKKLFPTTDYSKDPLHRQFMYALLLGHMTDREHIFSSEVISVLNGHLDKFAKDAGFTIFDEVSAITNPAGKGMNNIKYRLEEARKRIEPIFLSLLEKEIENLVRKEEEEKNKGQGEEQGQGQGQENSMTDPWGKPLGDIGSGWKPSLDDIKEIKKSSEREKKQKAEQDARDRMTPEEKAEDAQRNIDRRIAEQNNVPVSAAKKYRDLEKEVSPYKQELAQVFNEFMKTIDEKSKLFYVKYNRSGRFNIDSYIKKYGYEIASGNEQMIPWEVLDIYDKKDFMSRISLLPSDISVRLVLDTSGSMDEERIKTVSQVAVLMMEALGTFEDTVNYRFRMKNPFRVNTEIRAFGSNSEVIKEFSDKPDPRKEIASRFQSISKIDQNRGGTYDSIPLSEINNSIDPQKQRDLKSGKATEIVFLITDGGSHTEEKSKRLVQELLKKNVQVRGLQIGNPDSYEVETFNRIWQENGVGIESLGDLAPKMILLFKDFIRQMQTKVSFYEGDIDNEDSE